MCNMSEKKEGYTPSESEKSTKKSQKASKESQREASKTRRANYIDKRDRLKVAYSSMDSYKEDAKECKKEVKATAKAKNWKGSKYNTFKIDAETVDSNYKTYCEQLDAIEDAMLDKISEYDRLQAEEGDLIDRLWSDICSLGRWIRKYCN